MTTNLLDLWTEPKFNSERASQLFFGEILDTQDVQDGYIRITRSDGYSGWADQRFLRDLSSSDVETLDRLAAYVVTSPSVKTLDKSGKVNPSPHMFFYGTSVRARAASGGFIRLAYPGLPEIYLRQSQVEKLVQPVRRKPTGQMVVKEARKFLGVPYLWGGISTPGADCSGMIQTVFARFGIRLPRDTRDQITVGEEVARENIRIGDLLFFKRHVGLALDSHRLIHSSVGGSGVRIQSLRQGDPDYRPDLDNDFAIARRVL